MLTLAPFTFCANNVPGTDPIRAMDMARRCGFHTIELSAIDGISEQIVAERVSPEYVLSAARITPPPNTPPAASPGLTPAICRIIWWMKCWITSTPARATFC